MSDLDHKTDVLRLAFRPNEAARALGIGTRQLWSLTAAGKIPHLRLGRSVLYPVAGLEQWLAEKADAHNNGASND